MKVIGSQAQEKGKANSLSAKKDHESLQSRFSTLEDALVAGDTTNVEDEIYVNDSYAITPKARIVQLNVRKPNVQVSGQLDIR